MCATTSTYCASCPTTAYAESNSTTTQVDNHAYSANPQEALHITGVNSNAESYFSTGLKMDSAIISGKFDLVNISFSKPFVYAPSGDQFPTQVVNENFGYVPQTLIEWIAQHPDYISKFPGIVSCLPGGPSIDFVTYEVPPYTSGLPHFVRPNIAVQHSTSDLTFSSTVTITGKGCFHPGACSTLAAPAAMAVTATPAVTSEAHAQDSMFNLCHLHQGNHSY